MNQDKLGKNFINDYSKKFRKKKTEKIRNNKCKFSNNS